MYIFMYLYMYVYIYMSGVCVRIYIKNINKYNFFSNFDVMESGYKMDRLHVDYLI